MRTPCEIIVKYFLPAMRAQIAKELAKAGNTQVEIAEKLGLTQAQVSKYLSNNLDERVLKLEKKKEIQEASKKIASMKKLLMIPALSMICQTCRKIKAEYGFCKMHGIMLPELEGKCELCVEH